MVDHDKYVAQLVGVTTQDLGARGDTLQGIFSPVPDAALIVGELADCPELGSIATQLPVTVELASQGIAGLALARQMVKSGPYETVVLLATGTDTPLALRSAFVHRTTSRSGLLIRGVGWCRVEGDGPARLDKAFRLACEIGFDSVGGVPLLRLLMVPSNLASSINFTDIFQQPHDDPLVEYSEPRRDLSAKEFSKGSRCAPGSDRLISLLSLWSESRHLESGDWLGVASLESGGLDYASVLFLEQR